MASPSTQKISKAGAAFFSSLCATTFGLGCWQAQRYFEKIDQVQTRNEELLMEPRSLEKNAMCSFQERIAAATEKSNDSNSNDKGEAMEMVTAIDRKDFRPLSIRGKFMHEYEILVGPRGPPPGAISSSGPNSGRSSGGMASSPQGFYVITPFSRCNNMGTVLINRGWVPRQYVMQNSSWDRPSGIVNVIGVASTTERKFETFGTTYEWMYIWIYGLSICYKKTILNLHVSF